MIIRKELMTKRNIFFIIFFISIIGQWLLAETITLSGTLLNGRGNIEKCDQVRIKLYRNSKATAFTYTDESGAFSFELTVSGLNPYNMDTPDDFSLDQNYPNPFSENTMLSYRINTPGVAKLNVYDIRGQKVRSLVQDYHYTGRYNLQWNGRNDMNQACPQGIYFYILEMNGKKEMGKMTLMNATLHGSAPLMQSTGSFAKQTAEENIRLIIEDDDIENKIVDLTFPELTTSRDLGTIPIHVYPFLSSRPDSLYVLEGEDAVDTLDIYFEKPFILYSDDVEIDWAFTPDSTVAVHYRQVRKNPITLKIKENEGSAITYSRIDFDLDQRAAILPHKLRRAYVGIPYSRDIPIENNRGDIQMTLKNSLPAPMTFNGRAIQGTPAASSETTLYFDLEDDRNIIMQDSALLVISEESEINFNDYVIEVLEEYPRDGRYPYSWISGYHGVTRDLYYKGAKIAKANSDSSHSTYCSGITFEVYFRSMKRLNQDLGRSEDINGMSTSNLTDFISKWFVAQDSRRGPGLALESYGLGERIYDMNDVQKGDFVQIWRTTGSGHSVIFINWTTNTAGDTTGMRYWSTQTSTSGVNYNTEYFSGSGGSVDKAHTYYSRAFKPQDFVDFQK